MSFKDTFTAKVPKEVEEGVHFVDWEDAADGSLLIKVEATIEKIKNEGIVTSVKDLRNGLYEKKWTSGLRLYFAVIEKDGYKTLLLLGSGKSNEQGRAIQKARDILHNYRVVRESIVLKD